MMSPLISLWQYMVWLTHLSFDELQVPRALGVAVARSVLGTGLVGWVGRRSPVGSHLREVEGTVKTARKGVDVNGKGELLIERVEGLVLSVGRQQVVAGADVGPRNELQGECVAAGRDTIGTRIVSSVEGAVGSAGDRVGAERSGPGVAGVAVGISTNVVDPAPVGVKGDAAVYRGATASFGALLPGEGRVRFGLRCADLLTMSDGEERSREKSCFAIHGRGL